MVNSSYYQDPTIQKLGQAANEATSTAGEYASAASLLPQKLKQAILEKVNYNKDIIDQQAKAQANYFAAPAQAREQYQNIWNPFEREKLVTEARTQAYAPYASLTDILGQRMGNIGDIVNAGVGAFSSGVQAQQGRAAQAEKSYKNALDLAKLLQEQSNWSYEQTHSKPSSAAAKDPLEQMLLLAQLKMLGFDANGNPLTPETTQPTEPAPNYSPGVGEGATSPGRQWVYHTGEWMINTEAGGGNQSKPPISSFMK